jgi:hypothetical protein
VTYPLWFWGEVGVPSKFDQNLAPSHFDETDRYGSVDKLAEANARRRAQRALPAAVQAAVIDYLGRDPRVTSKAIAVWLQESAATRDAVAHFSFTRLQKKIGNFRKTILARP